MIRGSAGQKSFFLFGLILILGMAVSPVYSDTENIIKDVDNPTPAVGDLITYTITVRQTNPSWGSLIQVTDILPDQVVYVSHDLDPFSLIDTDVTVTGQEVFWWSEYYPPYCCHIPVPKVGQPGSERWLSITVQVVCCGKGILNIAEVTSAPIPPPPAQPGDIALGEQGDATIDVLSCGACLSIDKTGDPGPVNAGDTINYNIEVCNDGDVTLANVAVQDPKLNINELIPELKPGDCIEIPGSYEVKEGDLPGPVCNVATADSDQTEPVSDEHCVEINPPPGAIFGYVTDAATGNPLVALVIAKMDPEKHPTLSSKFKDGYYELVDLKPGTYTVLAYKKGYKLGFATLALPPLGLIQQDFQLEPK